MISIDEVLGPHQIVYDVYFSQADSTGSGIIGAFEANHFLKQSKLKDTLLKEIWDLSDPTGKGYLDRQAFYTCLKLVSLVQSNQEAKLENLNLTTPAPKLGELSSNITSLVSPDDPWYIKASNRIAYDRIFDSLSPINNKITGARVKPFLINSNLPVDVLGKIWELSDLDQDGQLDRDEFLIALQLVNKSKEGSTIPDQLPPSLLPFKIRHSSISSVPLAGGGHMNSAVFPAIVNEIKPWVVTFEEKTNSDLVFTQIDTDKDGFVSGAECKDVFLKSGVSAPILANIWAMCDIGMSGKLNCEQFALAMHFISKKLATGLDPPAELLPEMVPPSLRPKPSVTEEAHASKEFEELQTQVTELQREKLFYEQRATENEMLTRQKRTELTQLELEMESVFKTLQEREMKKSEEQKRLADCEERLSKVTGQLVDLRQKFEAEKSDVDKLRLQIQNVDLALRNKDSDLGKMKTVLQSTNSEYSTLESRLSTRKQNLHDLVAELDACNLELSQVKSNNECLKALQSNLTQLVKLYDDSKPGGLTPAANDETIRRLEQENQMLSEQVRANKAAAAAAAATMMKTSKSFTTSPQQQQGAEDPFQTVDDPFASSAVNDPFKSTTTAQNGVGSLDAAANNAFDAFGAFDPFGDKTTTNGTNGTNGNHDHSASEFDSFDSKNEKKGPVRPAPPRPQTPNTSANKNGVSSTAASILQSQRPQSAFPKMDFFSSSDASSGGKSGAPFSADPFDPFGWNASSTSNTMSNSKPQAKTTSAADFSEFDPFS